MSADDLSDIASTLSDRCEVIAGRALSELPEDGMPPLQIVQDASGRVRIDRWDEDVLGPRPKPSTLRAIDASALAKRASQRQARKKRLVVPTITADEARAFDGPPGCLVWNKNIKTLAFWDGEQFWRLEQPTNMRTVDDTGEIDAPKL